jgi:hypothetical protein
MNNAVYGKTLENIRNRVDIKLCTTMKKAQRLQNKPAFKRPIFIKDKEIIAIESQQLTITYNKPIFVGFSVLELSKLLMYQFHYDTIKARYGNKATLLYTDTDSLVYEIKTHDVYQDMLEMKDKFGFNSLNIF